MSKLNGGLSYGRANQGRRVTVRQNQPQLLGSTTTTEHVSDLQVSMEDEAPLTTKVTDFEDIVEDQNEEDMP